MNPEFVRPDKLYPLNYGDGEIIMVSAKYDRIDHLKPMGEYVLRVYDDEHGMVGLYLDDEEDAKNIIEYAGLPLVEREWITQSEYDSCIKAKAQRLNDSMFDFSEIDEESIIAEYDEEE
jgi:hypothetical protein